MQNLQDCVENCTDSWDRAQKYVGGELERVQVQFGFLKICNNNYKPCHKCYNFSIDYKDVLWIAMIK